MELDFTAEQDMLREMVRGVCAASSPLETVRALEDDPVGYSKDLWRQLADLDLIGLMLPEEHGGSGMGALEGCVLYEELGRALVPSPHFVSAVMTAGVLARAGDPAQQAALLPHIAAGDEIVTTGWLEPDGGFGPRGVRTTATPDGDGFRIDGAKWLVPFAASATRLLVLARTGPSDTDVDLFLVDPSSAGVELTQEFTLASENQYAVTLSEVPVGASDRIGGPGSGWGTWEAVLLEGAVLLAAQAIGGARAALEITTQYAKDREQFDKPLGAFQAIAHYLADAATAVEGGEILVHEAAWALANRRVGRAAGADGEAVRVQHVPRRDRHGPAGLRRRRVHARVRRAALLPTGEATADLLVGRPLPRGADRRDRPGSGRARTPVVSPAMRWTRSFFRVLPIVVLAAIPIGCSQIYKATCSNTLVASSAGPITDPALIEISGIHAGVRNPAVWWVHNDSGDTARAFALDANGALRGTYAFAATTAVDWEDLTVVPGPTPGTGVIYAADIGDNTSSRTGIHLYRVAEPAVAMSGPAAVATLSGVETLHFVYPDGAHDAETLMVDPATGEIVIMTKTLAGARRASIRLRPGSRPAARRRSPRSVR